MKGFNTLLVILTLFLMSCGDGSNGSDAYGNFEADEIIISANASGELMEFKLTEGQRLNKGEVIGLVDTVNLNLSRQEIQANLAVIESQMLSLNSEIEVLQTEKTNIEREIKRTESLLESKAATTKQLDDLKGSRDVLTQKIAAVRSQKRSIESQMKLSNVKLKQIDEAIQKSIVTSPLDAVVLNKIAQAHQLVRPGSPLFSIADLSTIYLRAYVSGDQLSQILLDQEVIVLIDHSKDEMKEYNGKITWISSESEFTPKIIQTKDERVDMVYALKISVKNDGALKIGMPGEVRF